MHFSMHIFSLSHNCPCFIFLFIIIPTDCQDGEVRLVGGDGDGDEGTVEVCYANLWGIISQVGWDDNDAKVVCRSLGFDPQSK